MSYLATIRVASSAHALSRVMHRVLVYVETAPVTSTGGMGREATVFYRHLADILATHWGQECSRTVNWLRCRCFAAPSYVSAEAGLLPAILCLGHWTYQWSLLRASLLVSLSKSSI